MHSFWRELDQKQVAPFDISFATAAQVDEYEGLDRLRFMGQFTHRPQWERTGVFARIIWSPEEERLQAFYALPDKLQAVVVGLGVITHRVRQNSEGFNVIAAEAVSPWESSLILGTLAADAADEAPAIRSEFDPYTISTEFILEEYMGPIVARSVRKRVDFPAPLSA